MKKLPKYSVTDIKKMPIKKFEKLIETKTFVITKYGKPTLVSIPYEEYKRIFKKIKK